MNNKNAGFIAAGGEMGEHIRSFGWSETALGPIESWPQSLRTILNVILNSKFPMFLFWGPQHIFFYNDAFCPSLGNEGTLPDSMGKPGPEFWAETWQKFEPLIAGIKAGGEASWHEDQLIPIYRNGKLENVYWTYSFSPVFDESGTPGGVLVTSIESTQNVLKLERLEESADEFRFAIEATELATWDLNPLTNKLKGNKRLKEWFGLGPDEEVDFHIAVEVIAEEDKARVIKAIQLAYQHSSGGQYDIEYAIVNPLTQQERHVRAKGRAWFNHNKEAYRFNGTLQDVTTKVLARKQLEESEQKIRAMIEAAPFPIAVYVGREMKVQMANQAVFDAWGKGNNVIGRKLADILPELKNQRILALLDQVFTTGIAFSEKKQRVELVVDNERQLFYFNNNFTPLFDEAGKVYGIMNTASDVTDLMLAQQRVEKYARELQESEQRFRLFVQASNDTLYKMSPDWKQMLTLEGKDFLPFTDKPKTSWINDYLPPEEQKKTLKTIEKAIRSKGAFELEHRVIKADGTVGWTLSRAIPVFNKEDEIIEWFGAATDITEQKQAQLALQESEQRFRNMADASPAMIWALNPDTSIKYINKFLLEFSGVSFEKFMADNWVSYIHPEDLDRSIQLIKKAIQERKAYRNEHRFLHHDGRYRWILSQGAPSYYANGDLWGYVGSSIDITEIKSAEIKLKNYARELAAANEELRTSSHHVQETNLKLSSSNQKLSHINADMDNFIYTASHDLRAPISNIEGLMDAIQRYLPDENKNSPMLEKLFGLVGDSIERFKRTINDLTEISKLEREGSSDGVAKVDLAEIIQEVQLDLSLQIEQAEAAFEIDMQESFPISYSAKNARSIVYNLISNAVKYRSPERPLLVKILCFREGDYLVLQVEDNGLGMNLNNENKIFGMFKRLHDHVEGTGVGLYIVKKIIENAGGKIKVESQVGQGTSFWVYFKQGNNA